jgi:hypothetical protein
MLRKCPTSRRIVRKVWAEACLAITSAICRATGLQLMHLIVAPGAQPVVFRAGRIGKR